MPHSTASPTLSPDIHLAPHAAGTRPRRQLATTATAVLVSTLAFGALPASGLGLGPAQASASAPLIAQSDAGGLISTGGLMGSGSRTSAPKGLDAPADWTAPGVKEGIALIGWVKAAVIVLGVLGMMGGVVVGKVLKETGNHHASGARATALGIGAAMVIAGAAPSIVPQLVG